jgi:hypothetical protein
MYSESDLDAAVAAGKLSAEEAGKFRAFIATQKAAPDADEEFVRLVSGFNDIFVSIAIILVLTALGVLTSPTGSPGLFVAAASWGLAEYFTRKRRMALPSILLLLTYVSGVAVTLVWVIGFNIATAWALIFGHAATLPGSAALLLGPLLIAAATYAHWRRFHVPITIAAGAGWFIFFGLAMLLGLIPALRPAAPALLLASGLAVFALGLRWDMADRTRITRRTDVAFWLHLLAAPLIVHPLFHLLGLLHGNASPASALAAIAIYLGLGLVALLVDRRALLVSGLFYLFSALSAVLQATGMLGHGLAMTALVAGAALLLLSAFWHKTRHAVLAFAPAALRQILPPA